ncbi:MAG: hypothetical protein IJ833_11000 [Lachnospiraceae bacterium]|nr:hypothetical protein [Lachnospiraceae bacterium]
MDKKVTGIVAYLTIIGWLVAFFAGDKEGAKFHLNQSLVLFIANIICGVISRIPYIGFVGGILSLVLFVFWIISFIWACQGKEQSLPLIGEIHLLK